MNNKNQHRKAPPVTSEKTVIKALGLGGLGGGGNPCAVDVKDGKIVRVRPMHYDLKYNPEQFNPWEFRRNGKTLKPLMKSLIAPFSLAYKKRAYSPNRIKYPLKRVDWDPDGERNTENRGKSKFKRISWDEAATIIANEIKRIHKQYGPLAICAQADGRGDIRVTGNDDNWGLEVRVGFHDKPRLSLENAPLSQGQEVMTGLFLVLAALQTVRATPILLLDELMSTLDEVNAPLVLSRLQMAGAQCFVATPHIRPQADAISDVVWVLQPRVEGDSHAPPVGMLTRGSSARA